MTGLYDAKVDKAPILAVSGQVASEVMGRGAFQDLNLTAAFADVADFSHTLQAGSDHAELTSLAMRRPSSGAEYRTWCYPTRFRCWRRPADLPPVL